MCLCVHVSVCMRLRECVQCIHVPMYHVCNLCMCVCTFICACMCVCVYLYLCQCVCTFICACVCVSICLYIEFVELQNSILEHNQPCLIMITSPSLQKERCYIVNTRSTLIGCVLSQTKRQRSDMHRWYCSVCVCVCGCVCVFVWVCVRQ